MPQPPRLVPVPPTAGAPAEVDRSPFWIGSGSGAAFRIYLPGIAERHASLTEREDGYYLSPFPGAASPRLDGQPVAGPTRLADGQVIELGPTARWEFVTGAPRAKPVEAEPEPQYAEPEPGRKRRWWRRRRAKRAGFPLWATVLLALVGVGAVWLGVLLVRTLRQQEEIVVGQPRLTEFEGQLYDSLMTEASKSIERGSTLLELGLEPAARQEFAKALTAFDTSPLGQDRRIQPSVNALAESIREIYRFRKVNLPSGLERSGKQVANLSTALSARLEVDQFRQAVARVQTAFSSTFARQFLITGADHPEHVSLYGVGGALDIRVVDLTAPQIQFLIGAFDREGIRVKDFSQDRILQQQISAALAAGRKDLAGTGRHLHIDRFRDRRDRWTVTS